jgi:hypothetical protein
LLQPTSVKRPGTRRRPAVLTLGDVPALRRQSSSSSAQQSSAAPSQVPQRQRSHPLPPHLSQSRLPAALVPDRVRHYIQRLHRRGWIVAGGHDNWVILGARCGRNSFSSGTTSVLRAVFASRDGPMASAPALSEATVSGQFVQIFGRKENPRGGDVLVKVRHR